MWREVEIRNREGIHARPAAEIVRCLRRRRAAMTIGRVGENRRFSADSILELLSANLGCGSRVTLEATGPEAERALDDVARLLGMRGAAVEPASRGESEASGQPRGSKNAPGN
jgi:phosphotransferase system HPr (HPr) family protein